MLRPLTTTLLLLGTPALAQDDTGGALGTTEIGTRYRTGVGAVLGSPTGVTVKHYLDGRRTAIEGAVGTETWGPGYAGLYVHATYQYHPSTLLYEADFEMPWYVGGGAWVSSFGRDPGERIDNWFSDYRTAVGVRGIVGLNLDLTTLPLQFYGEAGLNQMLLPPIWPGLHVAIGGRWYF